MQFVEARKAHYQQIINLVSSPEELYLVYPSGTYPWSIDQLKVLCEIRKNPTVVLCQGEVAAYANLYNIKPGESAFIGNVIVSDNHKGKGIGKALTQHMVQLCHSEYKATAHLSVFSYNTRALLMYSGLHFYPYAVEPRKNLQGEAVALIHMHQK